MKHYSSLLLLIFFWSCQPSRNDVPRGALEIGRVDSVYSEILGETRKILVHLPGGGNAADSNAVYPVLFLLDGDRHFHSVSGLLDELSAVWDNAILPKMMVVAIPNTNRSRDLTPTKDDIDFWTGDSIQYDNGGGQEFLSFIEQELIPYVDNKYPTAPHRTFVGHSFGGIAVLNALIEQPALFDHYIAIDPSLWWDSQVLIDRATERFTSQSLQDKGLYVSLAKTPPGEVDLATIALDTAKNSFHFRSILKFCRWLEEKEDLGLDFAWKYYPQDNHGSVPLISEYDGLRYLFSWYNFEEINELFGDPKNTPIAEVINRLETHFAGVSERIGFHIPPEQGLVNELGYYYLERDLLEESEIFFQMNLDNFPQAADAYDSMGDCLLAQKDTANAIINFQKGADMGLDYSQAKLDNLRKKNP